jgi:hypothetical protein
VEIPMKTQMKDVVFGLAGGVAGTFVVGHAMSALSSLQSEKDRRREGRLLQGQPTEKLAKKVAEGVLGRKLTPQERSEWGKAVHWTYGTLWGGLYAILRRRFPGIARAGALPFGISLGLFGNALLLPAAGLTPPAFKFPLSSHVRGALIHYAYGATVEGACRVLELLEGTIVKRPPRTNTALRRVS